MQRFYKGRTNNHLSWVMVDATDFATPESAMSAATKIKIYGKLRAATGVNFVSSGTGSLTNDIQHVGASATGIYTIALAKADLSDASAAWFDQYIVSLSATGAAYQALVVEGVIDDSALSGTVSDILSALLLTQSLASDAASAAIQANSRVLLNKSSISDIQSYLLAMSGIQSDVLSMLSDFYSDFQSRVPKLVATDSQVTSVHSDLRSQIGAITVALTASDISDIASAVAAATGTVTADIYSLLSDFNSDFQSRVPKLVATNSQLSDVASDLRSLVVAGVGLNASALSDVDSLFGSRLSDILSAAQQTNSRAVLVLSNVSDVQSYLVALSATISDIASAATAIKAKTDTIPEGIQKNQALANFEFMMVDSADHVTGKTGLTVTATRSIDGAAFGACANAAAEVANGLYKIDLADTDTNGTIITYKFTSAGADATIITVKTSL